MFVRYRFWVPVIYIINFVYINLLLSNLSLVMEEFREHKSEVDHIIKSGIATINNEQVKECLDYALTGGKRLRPIIILEMCRMFSIKQDIKNELVLLVEYLHNSSLILDDIPSMDDDRLRRGIPTFHIKYGVKTAYIITNYMINRALISLTNVVRQTHVLKKLAEYVFKSNNYTSIGQLVDLNGLNRDNIDVYSNIIGFILDNHFINEFSTKFFSSDKEIFKRVILLNFKTFPLFYLSFQLPVLLADELSDKIIPTDDFIQYISFIFSLSFQIADDFEDIDCDKNSFILLLGKEMVRDIFYFCVEDFRKKTLFLDFKCLDYVFSLLNKKVV
mgnify:CR=1 FL=1